MTTAQYLTGIYIIACLAGLIYLLALAVVLLTGRSL